MKTRALIAITLILQLAVWLSELAAKQAGKPNIVLILADDMGYGDLGGYSAEEIKTPNIDQPAAEGILFANAHCGTSTCTPPRYGLMTGRHAWRSWCRSTALSTNAPFLIEEDRETIASFLKSAGYSTSIVGKWHPGYGHEEGFEKNRGSAPPNYWATRGSGPNWNGELKLRPRENGFDYSYVIPVANSFSPYVFVENFRVAGLRRGSPIGKLESRNYGRMEDDLGEANNLYLTHPRVVHRLKVTLEKIKADENYEPAELEQPGEELTIGQSNKLFAASNSTDQSR